MHGLPGWHAVRPRLRPHLRFAVCWMAAAASTSSCLMGHVWAGHIHDHCEEASVGLSLESELS